MHCLDDCHTYIMDTFLDSDLSRIHFYEMREDGTKIDGVTNEEVLRVLIHRLEYLNNTWKSGKFKCNENSIAIIMLKEALKWLTKRTADRVARHVEGTQNV